MYTRIDTAFAGGRTAVVCGGTAGCVPFGDPIAGTPANVNIQDNGVWPGILRIQRNFWP